MTRRQNTRSGRLPAGLAAGVIILAAGLAWRTQYFVDVETTLLPWLMGRGWVLYRDLIDQHPPLFPALLAVLSTGDPGLPSQAVVVGWRVLTLLLTYVVAARWAGTAAGLGAVLLAEAWLMAFDGTHLWYDSALAPVYLGVLLLLGPRGAAQAAGRGFPSWWARGGQAFALGLLLAAGLLIKQHMIVAIPCVALALAYSISSPKSKIQNLTWLTGGLALPLGTAGLVLAVQGALDAAWYWVVLYNLTGNYAALAAQAPAPNQWPLLVALYMPALVYLIPAGRPARPAGGVHYPRPLLLGLLLAATLPVWPRYGLYHFHAAIPLLAVLGGVTVVGLLAGLRGAVPWRKGLAGAGLALLGWSALTAGGQWLQGVTLFQTVVGPPQPPYAATIRPLRTWVDAHAPPQAPILIYGLDEKLYRVLEREPPRPWAPIMLSWIRADHRTTARFWDGVARPRPLVAVVAASGWDEAPVPGPGYGMQRLRYSYHEVVRFTLVIYKHARPVVVVGLLRNDDAGPLP